MKPARYAPSPLDPRARAVADRLQARSSRQTKAAILPILIKSVRSRLRDGTWDPTQSPETKTWLADKLVALDPQKAALCYLLCRSLGARRVVEAGTSYGVSTIYLAAAVRDNLRAAGAPASAGVIGTEHEPAKVAAARANLTEAGLAEYVDVREGDLRETLRELPEPIDFMLVDIWIPMARPALELVTPRLRPGARGLRQRRGEPDAVRGVPRLRPRSERPVHVDHHSRQRRARDLHEESTVKKGEPR